MLSPRILAGVSAATLLLCSARVPAATGVSVIELFTSEGCSSCPPAERYLGELSARADVLALAFHVGYWDSLGWPDPFSFPAATERQNIYARRLGMASVYTPQLIIDGSKDFVGSDRRHIETNLGGHELPVPVDMAADAVEVRITIGAEQSASAGRPASEVVLVPFRRKATSRIGRGENAGRQLDEFNIARELRVVGHTRPVPSEFRVALASLPPDATDVAVLVQHSAQGEIVGAASLALAH